jgi:hypothetical protein
LRGLRSGSIGKHRESLLHMQKHERYSPDCVDGFYRYRNNESCIGITAVLNTHLFSGRINGREATKVISSLLIPLWAIPEYHEIGQTQHAKKMPRYLQGSGTYRGTVSRRFTIDCQLTHRFVRVMNIFVNLFGRAANFPFRTEKAIWEGEA